ncbi:cytochrome C peroxidase [Sphingobium sp. Leaf26]|uniref:methanobactin export MATE transporter MbnM n=1 Tax=Sphingobium sp. Leaf26 TaxID=1735693 RepID=UPI0006FD96DC|nr:methanobactin export MATE transporter MbnM [Sphingobium sp. Leaf26]KQN07101.1 cytochrome C peroxidase [Sphingobium sp. Leaf26]
MPRTSTIALSLSAILLLFSVAHAQQKPSALEPIDVLVPSRYDFGLPSWAPKPLEPAANPTTLAKVELGRRLFYDTRLSADRSMSCASCHEQARAFTDGRAVSKGVTGASTPRNAMSLVNVAYVPVLTWGNPLLQHLEQQALVPLIGQEPVELGLAGKEHEVMRRLAAEPIYRKLFAEAFPETNGKMALATVVRALSAFQRSIISMRSPYDRYRYEGDTDAVSDAAIRGEALFFSERLECHHCHNGLNLADTVLHERNKTGEIAFHNTGLYNIDGKGAYPTDNMGVAEITGRPEDMGRFRAPSLRNVAMTAPYMHDGSIATLDEVLDHYAAGGRTIASGPYAGVGRTNPFKSSFVPGFTLSREERADMLAFLNALTDDMLLHDPRFSNPWPRKGKRQ